MYKINIPEIDSDGAIQEAAAAVEGDTRLDFLKKAGVGAGAVVGGGTILSALAPEAGAASSSRPPKAFGKGDIGILNYALTLEYLEAAFYNEATAANLPLNSQAAAFLKIVTRDENAHVAYLKKALGKKAAKKPTFDFKGTTKSVDSFLATAQVLENTGVSAYSGQATNIKEASIVKAAVSILTIEARHASVIGLINDPTGAKISPDGAFDKAKSAKKILAAVKSTGFIVG